MAMQDIKLGGYVDVEVDKINANFAEVESDYAKTTDIPTVPTDVSDFNNDAGYQNATQVSTAVSTAVSSAVSALDIPEDLGDLTNNAGYVKSTDTAFVNKVDKENGKGLSTNDFDSTAKGKVDKLGKTDFTASQFGAVGTDGYCTASISAAGKYPVCVMRQNGSDYEKVLVHTKVSGNNIVIMSSEAFAGYVVTI